MHNILQAHWFYTGFTDIKEVADSLGFAANLRLQKLRKIKTSFYIKLKEFSEIIPPEEDLVP